MEFDNCFGCGKDNHDGLKLGERSRIEGESLVIDYVVEKKYQGFSGVLHGGIIATILDEAMGMSISRVLGISGAVTAKLELEFLAPVKVGDKVKVVAHSDQNGRKFQCTGQLIGPEGTVLARAASIWVLPR